jgi:RNase P/RNase MRP subunit POP5
MTDRDARKAVAVALQQARENPRLVKLMIQQLKASGEVEAGDLDYLDRIADKWLQIAENNRKKGR